MQSNPLRFAILTFNLFFIISFSFSQNWHTGSGGNQQRNGQTMTCGPADEMLLWEGGFNAVIAQQAVIEGNILVTSRIFNLSQTLQGTFIVAQDLNSGQYLWTKVLPVDFPNTDWRSRVTAIRDGQVYATRSGNTNKSYLYALDAETGDSLWRSEALIDEGSTESANFADNGDLIIGNNRSIVRIDHTNGQTLWEVSRSTPTSNGQEVAIYGDRGYYWEPTPRGPEISVVNIESGTYLYSSGALSPGLIQQLTPFVGPDGLIYAPRSMNNPDTDSLYVLEDTGSELFIRWTAPIGFVPFSTSGISPVDGSIYTYSRSGKVIRLLPDYGDPVDSSMTILTGTSSSPRMAIDAAGIVYVTNGEFDSGEFYVFNPDLTLRWSTPVRNVNVGGPAVGADGTLVVCGIGMDVRAYRGAKTSAIDERVVEEIQIYPNPVSERCQLKLNQDIPSGSEIQVYDQNQKLVFNQSVEQDQMIEINVSHLGAGPYVINVINENQILASGILLKI